MDKHRNLYEDPLSVLIWWYDLAIFLALFPSNSIIVFLRKNLGYRLMRPWVFWAIGIALWIYGTAGGAASAFMGGMTGGEPSGSDTSSAPSPLMAAMPVYVFVIAMGILAFIHRRRAWQLVFRDPDPVHTMSRGDSHLAKLLPVPEWIVQRYVEPFLVYLLSLLCTFAFHWVTLGTWLAVSALCLAGVEALVVEKSVNAFLDVRDSRIEAYAMQEMDSFTAAKPATANQKVGGLAMASPELLRLRSSRLNFAAPDNTGTGPEAP